MELRGHATELCSHEMELCSHAQRSRSHVKEFYGHVKEFYGHVKRLFMPPSRWRTPRSRKCEGRTTPIAVLFSGLAQVDAGLVRCTPLCNRRSKPLVISRQSSVVSRQKPKQAPGTPGAFFVLFMFMFAFMLACRFFSRSRSRFPHSPAAYLRAPPSSPCTNPLSSLCVSLHTLRPLRTPMSRTRSTRKDEAGACAPGSLETKHQAHGTEHRPEDRSVAREPLGPRPSNLGPSPHSPLSRSAKIFTPQPVGPLTYGPVSLSTAWTPAMSRWHQLTPSLTK